MSANRADAGKLDSVLSSRGLGNIAPKALEKWVCQRGVTQWGRSCCHGTASAMSAPAHKPPAGKRGAVIRRIALLLPAQTITKSEVKVLEFNMTTIPAWCSCTRCPVIIWSGVLGSYNYL